MTTRLNYFTADEQKSYGMSYVIYLKLMQPLPHEYMDPEKLLIAGFMLKEERDKYFAEFTDTELVELEQLELAMWTTDKLAQKKLYSSRIEKLKNAVQKRAGIIDS